MKRALLIVAILVFAGIGFVLTRNKKDTNTASTTTNTSQMQQSSSSNTNSQPANTQTITYDNNGFSPQKLTARPGDTIVLQNKSSSSVQFSSNPHPVHTDDPELNQSALAPGGQQSFKVTTKGTFGFHNHLDPSQTGTIVVQ